MGSLCVFLTGLGFSHQDPTGFLGVQPQVASRHVYFEAAEDAIRTGAQVHTEVSKLVWCWRRKAAQQVCTRAKGMKKHP